MEAAGKSPAPLGVDAAPVAEPAVATKPAAVKPLASKPGEAPAAAGKPAAVEASKAQPAPKPVTPKPAPAEGDAAVQSADPKPATPRPAAKPAEAKAVPTDAVAHPVPARAPAAKVAAQPQARAVTPLTASPPPPGPVGTAQGLRPVQPPAQIAHPRFRHWMLLLSFILLVLAPLGTAAWYLWTRAADQYVSTTSFSIRKEDQKTSLDMLGSLSAFTSSGGATDQNILYEYIRSADMVREVGKTIDLKTIFSGGWPRDFWYAYNPEGTIEDLVDYWNRQVTVLSDDNTGIITLKVSAFTPQDAKTISDAIFAASSATVNRLSDQSREDATRYANDEMQKAEARVNDVRQKLTDYRTRTQLVDPQAEFQSQMGVLTQLQSQLAAALIAQDMLAENGTLQSDPRFEQGEMKISAIESRIAQEREKFSNSSNTTGGESYAKMVAEYEQLSADRAFAEATYTSARATYDNALAEAQRQTRYLAAHVMPQVPEQSLRPNRPAVLALLAAFLLLGWGILLLVYYSVRDRA